MLRRIALACALAAGAAPAAAQTPAPARPTLLVFITIDQMRPDYFTRWPGQLTGGLARLYDGGAVFTDAHQDHAVTETAPGHASTMSGRFPRSTGIVSNEYGVFDRGTRLVGRDTIGASPFRFRGTVLADWMRAKDPRTRALSVSRKDRGAILPLGRSRQTVIWYGYDGNFTTSTWYARGVPAWVRRFNARRLPRSYAGWRWTPLLADSAYHERDDVPVEAGGDNVFPHVASTVPAVLNTQITQFPVMDQMTLGLAMEGLKEMDLGRGPATDILAISLSTTDAVGHRYGPDSREIHDQVVRLDRMLGAFLDSLYAVRDSSSIVIALTADHGVQPYPEVADPANAAAMRVIDAPIHAWLRSATASAGVDTAAAHFEDGMLRLDSAAFARARRDRRAFAREFVDVARAVPGVLRADLFPDVAGADTATDPIARRWSHMIPRDLPYFAVVTLRPGNYWGRGSYAQHGSPHDQDSHVPVIFYGAPFRPGRYATFARTADIAPTLARVLGATPSEPLDGHALTEAIR